jgi:EmrB/QacA subfamily drug resistance transporter
MAQSPPSQLTETPGAPSAGDLARRWWILAVVSTAWLMVVLDGTIVNVALPSAQRDLGFSIPDRQWVVTAYALTFGCLLLIAGRVSDIFGRKRTFIVGLAGFVVASVIGGAAPNFTVLVAARAVQGGFAALITPAALALLTVTFADNAKQRGEAFAIYSGIAAVGGAVGLLLGGILTQYLSWRWCMYVNVLFGGAAMVGAALLIVDHREAKKVTWDIPGSVLSMAGLAALVYGFATASRYGWGSPAIIGPIAAGVLLLFAFGLVERTAHSPLVPPHVIFDRTRGTSYLARTVGAMGAGGFFLIMTYYFQSTLHFSAIKTGLVFLPFVGGFIISAQVVQRRLLANYGPRLTVSGLLVIGAAGFVWLAQIGLHTAYGSVVPALVLLGISIGGTIVATTSTGVAVSDPADVGPASAMTGATFQVGQSIGAGLLNSVAVIASLHFLEGHGGVSSAGPAAAVHGYVVALVVLAVVFAAAAGMASAFYRSHAAANRSGQHI